MFDLLFSMTLCSMLIVHHAHAQTYDGLDKVEINSSESTGENQHRSRNEFAHIDSRREVDSFVIRSGKKSLTFPYSRIGMFTFTLDGGKVSRCTAFLVSPTVALTAAHCVFSCDESGKNCKRFANGRVEFGRFTQNVGVGSSAKLGAWANCVVPVQDAQASISFMTYPRDRQFDYAALYFPKTVDVFKKCRFDPLHLPIEYDALGKYGATIQYAQIVGYPTHVPATIGNQIPRSSQFEGVGTAQIINGMLQHQIPTTPGNSGGPIFKMAWNGRAYYQVIIGITSGGYWASYNEDVVFGRKNQDEIKKLIAKGN